MTVLPTRLFALQGAHNVRDLGGYETPAGPIRWRSVLRGDALHRLTPEDIAALRDAGLTTVIDLRNADEIAREPSPFADHEGEMDLRHLPLFADLGPVRMMADTDPDGFDMGQRYRAALDRCQPAIAAVLTTIARAPHGTVLFHCTAGKDRTGLIAALLLAHAGVDRETIVADYALTATIAARLMAELRARSLRLGTPQALVDRILAADPGTMRATLDHIDERYAGIASYLDVIGISAADLAALRHRMSGAAWPDRL